VICTSQMVVNNQDNAFTWYGCKQSEQHVYLVASVELLSRGCSEFKVGVIRNRDEHCYERYKIGNHKL
jgi:hypothetical protein